MSNSASTTTQTNDKLAYFWLWSVAHGGSELTKCYRVEAIAAVLIIILTKGHGGSTGSALALALDEGTKSQSRLVTSAPHECGGGRR